MTNNLKHLNILFLEDNSTFAEHTINYLKLYVHSVTHCGSIKEAVDAFENNVFDIILSDLKLSDGNALDFIEAIREKNETIPIVVISAHKDEEFLLKAIPLHLTAYEIKPLNFSKFQETLEKCASLVVTNNQNTVFVKDNIYYNLDKKIVIKDKKEIKLTGKEILFVELLLDNKNSIVSKEQLAKFVWKNEKMSESALKNFLMRIRKKCGKNFFYTVSKVGFRL
jgi:two-component system, OmpR family, response regulator VanR